MKTLYLDCFSGISGDMFLGLLLDLGLGRDQLEAGLAQLPSQDFQLRVAPEQRKGLTGCRVEVICQDQPQHRSWSSIDRMLADSSLPAPVSDLARRFFRRLGNAEAKVHGIPLDQVHFHEVGALDAIVDLTGAAIGLQMLGVERLICSPLPLSRGVVQSAHGPLPLPAPATLELLQGAPITDSGCERELVTPTGACIVAELAEFRELPALTIERTGYGVGGWQLEDRPNLLRGILGLSLVSTGEQNDEVCLLESHIDDSTPEQLGDLLDRLLRAGALDVGYSPLQMKKNRPGVRLTLVCEGAEAESLSRLILLQSSAIGVRSSRCQRFKLARRVAEVETPLGPARVKLLYDQEQFVRLSAEYDDCRELADSSGKPLAEVYRLVEECAHQQLKPTQEKKTND